VRGSHAASIVDRPLPRGAAAAGGGGGGGPRVAGLALPVVGGGGGSGSGAAGGGVGGDLPTVSLSAYSHLFSELIAYSLDRSSSIAELEDRLTRVGHDVGLRLAELLPWRAAAGDARGGVAASAAAAAAAASGPSAAPPITAGGSLLGAGASAPRRRAEPLDALKFVHSVAWPALFGKPADDLQQAHGADDEFMVADHDLLLHRHVSVPRAYASFVPGSLAAGVVRGLLAGFGLPAAVTAHNVEVKGRASTTLLVKFERSVMERRAYVAAGGAAAGGGVAAGGGGR
jgi:hypothetical protein